MCAPISASPDPLRSLNAHRRPRDGPDSTSDSGSSTMLPVGGDSSRLCKDIRRGPTKDARCPNHSLLRKYLIVSDRTGSDNPGYLRIVPCKQSYRKMHNLQGMYLRRQPIAVRRRGKGLSPCRESVRLK